MTYELSKLTMTMCTLIEVGVSSFFFFLFFFLGSTSSNKKPDRFKQEKERKNRGDANPLRARLRG